MGWDRKAPSRTQEISTNKPLKLDGREKERARGGRVSNTTRREGSQAVARTGSSRC